jgi:hypothetical protein
VWTTTFSRKNVDLFFRFKARSTYINTDLVNCETIDLHTQDTGTARYMYIDINDATDEVNQIWLELDQ